MANTALNAYGTPSGVIKGGPMTQNKTKPEYRMPRLEEEDYVVRGRWMGKTPWYQAPGSEPWKRNMTLLADYQRILRKEERQAERAEQLSSDEGVVSQDKKPMTNTALGGGGSGLGQTDTGSGGENEKKGDRGSFAMPKKLEPRHRRLLQRIKRMSKRALPPKPPAPLAPYQYEGSTGYTPTAAQSSTVRSGGIQGTILG